MGWENRLRHVPTALRNKALDRDGHRCTATLRNDTRCPEITELEAHELTRWYPGKRVTLDDLQILCHWHHNKITQQQAAANRTIIRESRPKERHPGLK